ncbi:MAG TPA: RluA family pseudouridine synthase [Planctomycetaceae bacterium]|nr:RluA family pseudouridine synthase [Planctomycetaceae bacterium]
MTDTGDRVYHLADDLDGLTVVASLKELNVDRSWGQVKKWLAQRRVLVNGNLCLDEARRVQGGDVIKLLENPHAKPVDVADIRLAHWDEHLLVVEKPAGITSVRHKAEKDLSARRKQLQPTLEELLPRVLAKVLRISWPPPPPKGLNRGRIQGKGKHRFTNSVVANPKWLPPELQIMPVHRLDRDTSGLMIFARSNAAKSGLIQMFRRHRIERQYIAVCHGTIEPCKLESYLVRDRGDGRRGSAVVEDDQAPEGALKAVTHLLTAEPIGSGDVSYSKLRLRLETGRTHQIRIHLSEVGNPICGDGLYFPGAIASQSRDQSGAPRQALHSDTLKFTHPVTGQQLDFTMALPRDLAGWLNRLAK